MVCLVYAYAQEVNSLKRAVSQLNLQQKIYWLNWRSGLKFKSPPANTKLIINVGFAGSLNNKFSCGQVCQIKLFLAKQNGCLVKLKNGNNKRVTKLKMLQDVPSATLFTSRLPVVTEEKKQALVLETQADLVDMEAFWLFKYAQALNIPFWALKVVSDNADAEAEQKVKLNYRHYAQLLAKNVLPILKVLTR